MLLNPTASAGSVGSSGVSPEGSAHAASAPEHASQTRMAYLVSRYPAVSHTFILREVRQLRELGFDIQVASINPPDRTVENMTEDERQAMAQTYYVKQHGWVGALAAHVAAMRQPRAWLKGLLFAVKLGGWNLRQSLFGFFYFTEALMLQRWMRLHQLHHLHVHFATAAANVGLVLKSMQPVGLSLTVHGPDEFYDAPGQRLQEKIMAADFVVCISRFARSQLMQLVPPSHWPKLEVCPLGVDPKAYAPARHEPRHKPFTILCVGRLTPVKGQRILIDACQRLAKAGRDFRLVLVGTGPDAEALQAAVVEAGLQRRTQLTGALNQDEVRAWYARADAFVLPSFAEGVPVVLMEAMACGIPCVTTRITGIPELIRDGQDGLLVTPSDVRELVVALTRLMDDPVLCEALGVFGRARVQAGYCLERNVATLAGIFSRRLEKTSC